MKVNFILQTIWKHLNSFLFWIIGTEMCLLLFDLCWMSQKDNNFPKSVDVIHEKKTKMKGMIYMNRKFLEDLGLEKEVIDKVLDEHSSNIGKYKGEAETAKQELVAVKQEVETLKGQLTERDGQLETLKKSTGDIDALKQQIETLQNDNKVKDEAHAAEIKKMKVDTAIENALNAAKSKNNVAVKALLKDLDKAELNEDGTVKGLKEQIDALVAAEDTKFLFNTETKQNFKGAIPGETGNEEPDGKVDLSKMTYDERAKYLDEHPEVNV